MEENYSDSYEKNNGVTSTQISQHEKATDEKEEDIDVGANISLLDSMEHKKKHMYSNIVTRIWHTDWCPWIPARYVLAVMSFLGFVNVYALRVNLSMALVVMVNNTKDAHLNNVRIIGYLYMCSCMQFMNHVLDSVLCLHVFLCCKSYNNMSLLLVAMYSTRRMLARSSHSLLKSSHIHIARIVLPQFSLLCTCTC